MKEFFLSNAVRYMRDAARAYGVNPGVIAAFEKQERVFSTSPSLYKERHCRRAMADFRVRRSLRGGLIHSSSRGLLGGMAACGARCALGIAPYGGIWHGITKYRVRDAVEVEARSSR